MLLVDDLAKQVTVNDTELRAYYEANKARYQNSIPEQRKARYMIVDTSKVPVQVTDKDYSDYYAAHQDEFKEPEQADVWRILVKTEQEALDIKKQLDAGESLKTLRRRIRPIPAARTMADSIPA